MLVLALLAALASACGDEDCCRPPEPPRCEFGRFVNQVVAPAALTTGAPYAVWLAQPNASGQLVRGAGFAFIP
jgi:hypothetical protein